MAAVRAETFRAFDTDLVWWRGFLQKRAAAVGRAQMSLRVLTVRFWKTNFLIGAACAGTCGAQIAPPPGDDPLSDPIVAPSPPPVTAIAPSPLPYRASVEGNPQLLAASASLPTTIAAGRTPAVFSVSNSGSSNYTVPIWAPPGIGALQLKVALTYNSQNHDGVMGVGWNLSGMSAIARCNRTWAQDGYPQGITLTTSDRLCLDGRQLKVVTGTASTPAQGGTTFATEIDSFSRIVATGATGSAPASLTITTKNGLIYDYGLTTDSQIMAGPNGPIRTWALSQIRDRAGNKIKISYYNDAEAGSGYTSGSYRVKEIDYPYTASGQGPFYSVTFGYGGRLAGSNVPSSYIAGGLVKEPNQLNTISVQNYGSSTPTKTYALTYGENAVSSRLQLQEIQECSASNCVPATLINYQHGAQGWSSSVVSTGVSSSPATQAAPIAIDLNADGLADLLYPVTVTSTTVHWWVLFAGSSTPVDTGLVTSNFPVVITGTFSGRGQNQFIAGGAVYTCTPSTGCTHATTTVPAGAMFAADYDGDGLPDLVSGVGNSVLVTRNITQPGGAVTFAATPTTVWTTSSSGITLAPNNNGIFYSADYNADGRADILATTTVNTGFGIIVYWNVLLSNGFSAPATALAPIRANGQNFPLAGDWNGDGCTDIISLGAIYISNCAGGFSTVPGPSNAAGASAALALDWDGDGNTDLLYNNSGTWYVARSTGTGIATGIPVGLAAPTSTSWFPADLNGDGLLDMAYVDANDSNKIKYVLHAGASAPADLATSFSDGFAINQSPTYVPISQSAYSKCTGPPNSCAIATFPEQDFQGPLYVVNQFTASDGTGSTYQNQFLYTGARIHVQGRGFEGFNSRRTYDSRSGLYIYDYEGQQFPYQGMFYARWVNTIAVSASSWLGTLNEQTVTGLGGHETRWFPYLQQTVLSEYEVGGPLNASLIKTTTTQFTYGDGFGNPTQVQVSAVDNDSTSPFYGLTWQVTRSVSFLNDTTAQCLGLPSGITTLQSVVPGQTTQTRTFSYTPDSNHALCREQAQVMEPNTAALTVTTALSFDSCGNPNSVTVTGHNPDGSQMQPRTTAYNFGTRCQLPVSMQSAMGSYDTSLVSYNYDFGVPATFTDANGAQTAWQQDDFGRTSKETHADNTYSTFTYPACAAPPCWSPTDLRFIAERNDYDSTGKNVQSNSLYYDGFNRLRYDESYRVGGVWNTNKLIGYDSLGRITRSFVPFSSSGSGYGNGFWSLNYDVLNRPTLASLYQSNGSTIDRTLKEFYQGRTTTTTDPLNHNTNQVTDVMGRLRQVKDPAPGGTTSYDFDVFGNLNKVTDTLGPEWAATYNVRGFKTQMVDADAGTWNFSGDSLNELVSWTDANNKSFGAAYDALGRLTSRSEPEGTSTWTWDVLPSGCPAGGKYVGQQTSETGYGYVEMRCFDAISRLQTRIISTDQLYQYDYTYNSLGAIDTITYPTSPPPQGTTATRYKIQYGYDGHGFVNGISDVTQPTATTLWSLTSANDYSSPTSESLGAGIVSVNSTYTPWTNDLKTIQSGVSGSTINRQNLAYTWDTNGNLQQRQDLRQSPNLTEIFSYDALNRLVSSTLNAAPNFSASYVNGSGADQAGNIWSRSDVGSYTYGDAHHPHGVTTAGSYTFTYDASGNVATRNGLQFHWASYNLPTVLQATMSGTTYSSAFAYGPDHQRYQQSATYSNGSEVTFYAGGLLEKVTGSEVGGVFFYRHFVPTPTGQILVVSRNSDNSTTTTYVLSDHLGSSDALVSGTTGTAGNSLVQESFGAFGLRRQGNWALGSPSSGDYATIAATTRHGFTFHEELDNVGLIHMNGRVYDPNVGRFMSADPVIGDLADSQSINAYAYVGNRPLSAIDPTGLVAGLDEVVVEAGGPTNPVGVVLTIADVAADIASLFGLFGSSPPPPPPASVTPNASAQSSVGSNPCGTASAACGMAGQDSASVMINGQRAHFWWQGPWWLDDPRELATVTVWILDDTGNWVQQQTGLNPNWRRSILGDFGLKALEWMPFYDLANCVYSAGGCGAGGWLKAAVTTAVPEAKGALAIRGGLAAVRAGQAGEAAVRGAFDIGRKTAIDIAGQTRIPDGLTRSVLTEVKNVNSLSYTRQLRDFATYSRDAKLRFDLYVRPGAQLSGPLRAAEAAGDVNILEIPFP